MRALVVYESMYGNTRKVAEAVASGLGTPESVKVLSVADARQERPEDFDLVVAGGPTHIHGMSRPASRKSAVDAAHKPDSGIAVEPGAGNEGIREWLEALPEGTGKAAAFDTRMEGPAFFTGRASKGIEKMLHRHGFILIAEPESFLVGGENALEPTEEDRARSWGAMLAERLSSRG